MTETERRNDRGGGVTAKSERRQGAGLTAEKKGRGGRDRFLTRKKALVVVVAAAACGRARAFLRDVIVELVLVRLAEQRHRVAEQLLHRPVRAVLEHNPQQRRGPRLGVRRRGEARPLHRRRELPVGARGAALLGVGLQAELQKRNLGVVALWRERDQRVEGIGVPLSAVALCMHARESSRRGLIHLASQEVQ